MTLLQTQRRMAAMLMMPSRATTEKERGPLSSREAASLIKPNRRLSSVERLDIYRRSYWSRLTAALTEDFPGLCAVLGARAFDRIAIAYLTDCPSRSFTLRNLGSSLESWLGEHPEFAGRNHILALEMARLEWAHIVAFDGPQAKVPGLEDLRHPTPRLRIGVQPYVSLLELHHPVDELRLRVNSIEDQGSQAASNFARQRKHPALQRISRVQPERVFLVVHRLELTVYYRRISLEEFRLLRALRSGRSIGVAIRAAFYETSIDAGDVPGLLKSWFSIWAEFGWLSSKPSR
jgi:hypothetical protein